MSERILVTGGMGFVFSNFIRWGLTNTDYDFVSLDRIDEAARVDRFAELRTIAPGRVKNIWHDLRAAVNPAHYPELRQPFRYVVHAAAMSHVDRSTRDPVGTVLDNVMGTVNLLEYVRHHQPDTKLLGVSTDEVFGPAAEGVEFGEHDRWEPENVYAASKCGAEALYPAYVHQYGLRIVVTHCSNVYGGGGPDDPFGQYREKFIPLCVDKVRRGEVVQIHARNGVPSSRLYIHVDDVAAATMTVLEKGGIIADDASGRYNIVSSGEWSNLDVAQRIAALLGKPLQYELTSGSPGRPKPDMRYALRGDKLRALGWSPKISLDDGLRQVVLGEAIGERAA